MGDFAECFEVEGQPDISIIKTAGDAEDDTVLQIPVAPGQTTIDVVYHYHVCNEGGVALTDVVGDGRQRHGGRHQR